ncbi:MAG: RNA polymerase sigma factor [Mesorhizobium sp.]
MSRFEDRIVELIPVLRRYASSLARNRPDAEDLLQEAIATALAHERAWRGDNLRGWLSAIMTNIYRNQWRRGISQANAARTQTIVEQQAPADGFARQRIVAALDRLDADQRAVLMLVVVEGYTYAEVAETLGLPAGTVMSRLSRARHRLAAELDGSNVIELRRP